MLLALTSVATLICGCTATLAALASHASHAPQTVLSSSLPADPYPTQPLVHFNPSQRFKIIVVTDTHLLDGNGSSKPEDIARVNAMSQRAVRTYIRDEGPDYVVHLGDFVSGEFAHSELNVSRAVTQILEPIAEAGIPLSSTKGNHGNDKYSTHLSISQYEHAVAGPLSYTRQAPPGVGGGDVGTDNYWVPIHANASSPRGSRPELILWFFDSRGGKTTIANSPYGNGTQGDIEDWVHPTVGPWIEAETRKLTHAWGEPLPPSIVFTHIPAHAFAQAQTDKPYGPSHVGGITSENEGNFTVVNRTTYPGLNADVGFGGQGGEYTNYKRQDRVYLDAFLGKDGPTAKGSRLHAIVSGHEHGNDWCSPSQLRAQNGEQIVPVCFAKHSGFGGYDETWWAQGARVFTFDRDNIDKGVGTHVRFLSGEKRYATELTDKWTKLVSRS
ncbi:Metallo-dependent phosphatase [Jaminaea rosea]|uniref:Metallo-dependent phosphatase n=1 Tax=Jaminaea rosea TaxID=1569628 RepID=A0A316UNW0_9BASI|nr:Metallo-dependent phosphatase [Jaminaea rosea]PWN25593.1 Metallo-dependent phosphatase [Jaminaea rosea]